MPKFRVTYEEVRPGWDEFNKRNIGDVVVEAPDHETSFKVADTQLGKYFNSFQSVEIKEGVTNGTI